MTEKKVPVISLILQQIVSTQGHISYLLMI